MNESDFIMKNRAYIHLQHEILETVRERCIIPNANLTMHRSGVTINDDEIYTIYIDGRALISLKIDMRSGIINDAYFVMNDNLVVKGYCIMTQKSLYELKQYVKSFVNTVFTSYT